MTNNEKELLNLIRTHDNPERAIEVALKLMVDFLERREELQGTSSARPRESA